ncbi:MAG: hypothetical protein ABID54_05320, partial [Pseudomonadota bacterium]
IFDPISPFLWKCLAETGLRARSPIGFLYLKDNGATLCVRLPRIEALKLSMILIIFFCQAKLQRAPAVFKNQRIV